MKCFSFNPSEIKICLSSQTLIYQEKTYFISSSRFGMGTKEGSYKTPLGTFQVSEYHGSGEHIYSIFKGRRKTGEWSPAKPQLSEDMILARILRLSGLNADNGNTYTRYVYIHGTNNEKGIGHPYSMGCIRMQNSDMIELYNTVSLGTVVKIQSK